MKTKFKNAINTLKSMNSQEFKKMLIKIGIINKNGKLTNRYRVI